MLNAGRSYIHHIPDRDVASLVSGGRFVAVTDFAGLAAMDAILICVPTPLTRYREPDLSYVVGTTLRRWRGIGGAGNWCVLESTTYPGTTREVMRPILERGGLRSGEDFFLAYSPEREDPGNKDYNAQGIPKVVGGDGADALLLTRTLYDQFVTRTVPVLVAGNGGGR